MTCRCPQRRRRTWMVTWRPRPGAEREAVNAGMSRAAAERLAANLGRDDLAWDEREERWYRQDVRVEEDG